jgi:hypothetical protein
MSLISARKQEEFRKYLETSGFNSLVSDFLEALKTSPIIQNEEIDPNINLMKEYFGFIADPRWIEIRQVQEEQATLQRKESELQEEFVKVMSEYFLLQSESLVRQLFTKLKIKDFETGQIKKPQILGFFCEKKHEKLFDPLISSTPTTSASLLERLRSNPDELIEPFKVWLETGKSSWAAETDVQPKIQLLFGDHA